MVDTTFYDNEGTGLSVRHDQITQFGGITCGSNLEIKDRASYFIRLLPYVVPHPDALRITRKKPNDLSNSRLPSEYEIAHKIADFLGTGRDDSRIFVTFNGLKYDDELIRTTLYRNLRDPFFNSGKNHIKIDLLNVLKMVHGLSPEAINIPVGEEGKPTYRLEAVCPANGIEIHAHDALNDSIATRDLYALILKKAPWAIDIAIRSGSSHQVRDLIEKSTATKSAIYNFTSYGSPLLTPLVFIGNESGKKYIGINPNCDLQSAKSQDISDQLFVSDSPFQLITTNKFPLLLTEEELNKLSGFRSKDTMQAKIEKIQSDATLKAMAIDAFGKNSYEIPVDSTSEEKIYDGFFSSRDKQEMKRFSEAKTWEERAKINFLDPRLKDFSARIILEAVKAGACALPSDVIKGLGNDSANAFTRPFHTMNTRYNTISQCLHDNADDDWIEWAKMQYGDHAMFNQGIEPVDDPGTQKSFAF